MKTRMTIGILTVALAGTMAQAAPVAKAVANRFASFRETVILDGSQSLGSNGLPGVGLTYLWTAIGLSTPLSGANTAKASFVAGMEPQTFQFRLLVKDSTGASSTSDVFVMVVENKLEGVFVSRSRGSDSVNDGSRQRPFATLERALQVWLSPIQLGCGRTVNTVISLCQSPPKGDIYVEGGEYASVKTLQVTNGVSIYGGFSVATDPTGQLIWTRDGARPTVIRGANVAMSITGVTVPTRIDGLTIYAADGTRGMYSLDSVGIWVVDSNENLHIRNNRIFAGKGFNGQPGLAGIDGKPGSPGQNAWEVKDVGQLLCDTCSLDAALGGKGAVVGSGNLPGGGRSGQADPLLNGEEGSGPAGGGGGQSVRFVGENWKSATTGRPGGNGASATEAGVGGAADGAVLDGRWLAWGGRAGGNGTNGRGGGGGGGAVRWGVYSGAAGGGGGGAGSAGTGGKGGSGGGSSIGIMMTHANPMIVMNSITTAGGGDGGPGGAPGCGGCGGNSGGNARFYHDNPTNIVFTSGRGGVGGWGGCGAGGGGGAGGASLPWLEVETGGALAEIIVNEVVQGSAGLGGPGGKKDCQCGGTPLEGQRGADGPTRYRPSKTIPPPTPPSTGDRTDLIPAGANSMSFASAWTGDEKAMTLISPSGIRFDRTTVNPLFGRIAGPGYESLRIANPEPGEWRIAVRSASAPVSPDQVRVERYYATANSSPRANAGLDRVVEAESASATAVELDASLSSDQDGDPLRLEWRDSASRLLGSGARLNLSLPLGDHTVNVAADDGRDGVSNAAVRISVRDTTPPDLSFSRERVNAVLTSGLLTRVPVSLAGIASATDAVSSSITVTHNATATFPVGVTVVQFSAADQVGNVTKRVLPVHVTYGSATLAAPGASSGLTRGTVATLQLTVKASDGSVVTWAKAELGIMNLATGAWISAPLNTFGATRSFTYDAVSKTYRYQFNTLSLAIGSYRVYAVLDDRTVRTVDLTIR